MVVFAVLAVFVLVMLLTKGIGSPAKIFAILWLLFILGYYCFTSRTIPGMGVLWIAVSILVFAVGERIGTDYAAKKYKVRRQTANCVSEAQISRLSKILVLIILLALLSRLLFLYVNGYGLSVFFSIEKFMAMNTELAYARYHGLTVTNSLITLLSSFCYVAPLCGGYLLMYAGKKKRIIFLCILSLLPILLGMLTENTKSGVIDSAILFIIGLITAFMTLRKHSPKLKFKHIAIIIFLALILFALLFISMCVRIGDFSSETINIVKEKFIVYAFGSVEAFDVWLSDYYTYESYGFGVNTFMAPFNLLGIVTRAHGVYGFLPGVSSNVFSAFRGVILDFGVVGGLLFMFILGVVGGVVYVKIRRCGSVGAQLIYAALLFFLIRSFLISPWIYSSFWVTFVVFLGFIYLALKRPRKKASVKQGQIAQLKMYE